MKTRRLGRRRTLSAALLLTGKKKKKRSGNCSNQHGPSSLLLRIRKPADAAEYHDEAEREGKRERKRKRERDRKTDRPEETGEEKEGKSFAFFAEGGLLSSRRAPHPREKRQSGTCPHLPLFLSLSPSVET